MQPGEAGLPLPQTLENVSESRMLSTNLQGSLRKVRIEEKKPHKLDQAGDRPLEEFYATYTVRRPSMLVAYTVRGVGTKKACGIIARTLKSQSQHWVIVEQVFDFKACG